VAHADGPLRLVSSLGRGAAPATTRIFFQSAELRSVQDVKVDCKDLNRSAWVIDECVGVVTAAGHCERDCMLKVDQLACWVLLGSAVGSQGIVRSHERRTSKRRSMRMF